DPSRLAFRIAVHQAFTHSRETSFQILRLNSEFLPLAKTSTNSSKKSGGVHFRILPYSHSVRSTVASFIPCTRVASSRSLSVAGSEQSAIRLYRSNVHSQCRP